MTAARLATTILKGVEDRAAQAFPDARCLALRLHNVRQSDDARLALSLALAFDEITYEAHRAAELATEVADLAGEVVAW